MQTRSIIITSTLTTLATAAAITADIKMPTLGGPAWYDLSASSTVAVAAASTTLAAGQWSPAPVAIASSSTWQAAPVASSASWSAVSVPVVSSTSVKYENPFTIYTTMTNEWGVITGMPAVVTSQPAVVTSQPTQPIPAGVTPSSSVNTTMMTATKVSTESFVQSRTASAVVATLTGAAANVKAGLAGFVVAGAGVAFAML